MSHQTNNKMKAQTIINQLGGNKFASMTNAYFMTSNDSVVVKFQGSQVSNCMTVTLNSDDTYSVKFDKVRGLNLKTVKEMTGVFAEDIQSIFTQVTGLKTSF